MLLLNQLDILLYLVIYWLLETMLEQVSIRGDTSAIVIGSFSIDGFAEKPYRIITHAHSDHVVGIKDSLLYSRYIIATPATHDLLLELGYIRGTRYRNLYRTKRYDLDYNTRVLFDDEKLVFYPTTHILGSAQVLIEYNGYRIGYTSDFKLGKHTVIMKDLDILVIEATYGNPLYRRVFKNDVIDLLIDIVYEGLYQYGRVKIYGYYGKLQEIMRILREKGVEEPFIMNKKIYNITRIAEKYGWNIKNYYCNECNGSNVRVGEKHILFEHMVKAKYRRLDGSVLNIVLSGHEYREPVRKVDEYTWLVAFSDHADFDELLRYVEESHPRIIIVDGSREGYPYIFAKELRKRGWKAYVMPSG